MEYKFDIEEAVFEQTFKYKPFGEVNTERKLYYSTKWTPTYKPNENTNIYVFRITAETRTDIGEFRFCNTTNDVNTCYMCVGFGGWNNTKSIIGYCDNSITQQRLILTNQLSKHLSRKLALSKKTKGKQPIQPFNELDTEIYIPDLYIGNKTDVYWFKFVRENDVLSCTLGIGKHEPLYVYKMKNVLTPNIVCIGGWHSQLDIEVIDTKQYPTFGSIFQSHSQPSQSLQLSQPLQPSQVLQTRQIQPFQDFIHPRHITPIVHTHTEQTKPNTSTQIELSELQKPTEPSKEVVSIERERIDELSNMIDTMSKAIDKLKDEVVVLKRGHNIEEQNHKLNVEQIHDKLKREMNDELETYVNQHKHDLYQSIEKKIGDLTTFVDQTVNSKIDEQKQQLIEEYESKLKNKVTAIYEMLNDKYKLIIDDDMENYKNTLRYNTLDKLDVRIAETHNEMKSVVDKRMKEIEDTFMSEESANVESTIKTNIRKYKTSITEQISNDLETFKTALDRKLSSNMKSISSNVMETAERQMSNDMSNIIEETVNIAKVNLKEKIQEVYGEIKGDIYSELFEHMNKQKDSMIGISKIDMSKKHIELMNDLKERYGKMKENIVNDIDEDIRNFETRLATDRKIHMSRLDKMMEEHYNKLLIDVKMRIADNKQLGPEKQYELENIVNESLEMFGKEVRSEANNTFSGLSKNVTDIKSMYSPVNQYFDRVYVINLDSRTDRMTRMEKLFEQHKIMYKRISAFDGQKAKGQVPKQYSSSRTGLAEYGYCQSMKMVLEDAQQNNYEKILVFDDDVIFCKSFNNNFMNVVCNRNVPTKWKLLYLGASQHEWDDMNCDDSHFTYTCARTDGSFAVGIHRSVFGELIDCIKKNKVPFDGVALRYIQNKYKNEDSCVVLKPNLVIADVSESDIRGKRDMNEMAIVFRWRLDMYELDLTEH
jgi:GR25 family glycosyltransferase involved in LPS biosynthesis